MPKRSEVERVAREISDLIRGHALNGGSLTKALAAWHLRALRRARGDVQRLRRALTFYATENAYAYQGDIHLMGSCIADAGAIARSTLDGNDPMGNAERSLRRAKAKDRLVPAPRRKR